MARIKPAEPIDCFFSNGLWLPGRTLTLGSVDKDEYFRIRKGLTVLSSSLEPLTIIMNSDGGSAVDGMAIYGAISRLSNHVTILVEGEASSMGAVILQAADHRLADRHAVFMLHDGSDGVLDVHARDFEKRGEESKRTREEMYQIFAEKTGKPKAYFRRKLAHDWYLTAEEALKEGLIDGIAA